MKKYKWNKPVAAHRVLFSLWSNIRLNHCRLIDAVLAQIHINGRSYQFDCFGLGYNVWKPGGHLLFSLIYVSKDEKHQICTELSKSEWKQVRDDIYELYLQGQEMKGAKDERI